MCVLTYLFIYLWTGAECTRLLFVDW